MKNISRSSVMKIFSFFGFAKLAWSLRRLHCPVNSKSLVLDVGSGGNPYPRANVLLDAYEETFERYHLKLVKDRPLVYGVVENMPFKDKAFDFVIASHILEHVSEPEKFLNELMRVSKAGYIETPDAFIERLIPFRFHRLEVTDDGERLVIYKKSAWRPHTEIVDLFEKKAKNKYFIKLMQKKPDAFYTRYYWNNEIDYQIVNPEVTADWPHPAIETNDYSGKKFTIRGLFTKFIRFCFSQNSRNNSLDIISLLRCTTCHGTEIIKHDTYLKCTKCQDTFILKGGIPVMNEAQKRAF